MSSAVARPHDRAAVRVALGFGIGALLLVLLALLAPGHAAFFPLMSLWCNLAVFAAALGVLRIAAIRLDLFHGASILVLWAAALLYAYWALGARDFVYYWDYSNYLSKQYMLEAAFAQGAGVGFAQLFGSFAEDYTDFLCLFLEFPFCLSDGTGDSYAFCQVFSVLPTLLILLAGLVIKAGQMLRVRKKRLYFLIGFSWLATYPFLRMSAMLAQPDWYGLVFAFAILLLTLDYRFAKPEPARLAALFAATAGVILCRRWYLYFVVGYYVAYALLVTVSSLRARRAARILRLAVYGLCAMAAMVVLFFPMVRHILSYDYAGRYSFYDGGFAYELSQQFFRIGLLNFLLIALGLRLCVKRRLPALPCLAGLELCLSLLLFTRVQSTGSHQMLLFVPGWFLLFLPGAAALADTIRRHTALKLGYWAFTVAFAVSVRCSPLTVTALPGFVLEHLPFQFTEEFVRLDGLTYDRKDLAQIQSLAQWIDTHCAAGEHCYMIPHDMLYCPDYFKNCQLPAAPINDKLSAGFSVPGTHDFPMEFFDARYVITADPFPQTYVGQGEMSHKLNAQFLAVRDDAFALAATFDMGNGTTFTIWERTAAATRAEVEYYLSAFAQEDATYPEMFSERAERWLAERGL